MHGVHVIELDGVLHDHLPVRFKGIFLKGVSEAEHLKDSRGSPLNTQIIEIN